MIGTSSSQEKLDRASELGMDVGIDYTTEDIPARVAEITGGKGVDLVFEHVGGELFQKGLESLAPDGRLVTCGGHAQEVVPFDIIPFFRAQHTIIGSFVYTREELEKVLAFAARGQLQAAHARRRSRSTRRARRSSCWKAARPSERSSSAHERAPPTPHHLNTLEES